MNPNLFAKYDVPVPRYTSYPTVPYWCDSPTTEQWLESVGQVVAKPESSWSIYVHLPFCETLCTFCGCNTVITRNHDKEDPYVAEVLREFQLYLKKFPDLKKKPLRQLHLGGGTPTFLSAANLRRLVSGLLSEVTVDTKNFEGALEVDPRRTTFEQLEVLREFGFTRVSMGVQDFNPEVQRLVNRIQPLEETLKLTEVSRDLGYTSVNYDLIYGLPKQTLESFKETVESTVHLRPDRIALYSFALVPWIKPQQRLFKDSDLPVGRDKRELYELAYQALLKAGYVEIGMDHFALPTDSMAVAMKQGHLHRNFMGYADVRTDFVMGLGVSSISETPNCFHQNEKVLTIYEKRVQSGEIPTLRGHRLSEADQHHREQILEFMCRGEVVLSNEEAKDAQDFLSGMINDQLVKIEGTKMRLTPQGRPFLRNACVVLDQRLRQAKPETKVFSQAL